MAGDGNVDESEGAGLLFWCPQPRITFGEAYFVFFNLFLLGERINLAKFNVFFSAQRHAKLPF
jgi:hypothetical protein